MKTVVFDLDSTLADTRHRQWMIPLIKTKQGVTWDDYSMACDKDEPIAATVKLASQLAENWDIVIVTGRSAAARPQTEEWLWKNDVPYQRLIMRPEGDRTPNPIFKWAAVDLLIEKGHSVELVIDDLPAVAEIMREHHPGIPVLLVNPGYHGEEGA